MSAKYNLPTFQDFSYGRERLTKSSVLKFVILFASLSFFLTLFLPSVGEEGVYTNITLEMLYNNEYLVPTLYGSEYYRPPLFNWLILGVIKLIGPAHVVFAARLVNMTATLMTAVMLVWFVRRIFPERQFALLTGAVYLSGDLLFKRGWLAYADSVFALFVFASIVCLWLALETKESKWFVVAGLSLIGGFLSKVHTIYLFYAIAGLVLLFKHKNSKFMFRPTSWFVHLLAFVFPFAWAWYVKNGKTDIDATANYSLTLLQWPGFFKYILHVIIEYPLNLIARFLPLSIIAVVMWHKMRTKQKPSAQHENIKIVFWIALLNLLPYWLAPTSTIRYVLPLYPFVALLISYIIWQAGNPIRRFAVQCLIAGVVLKYIFAIWWLPYEHSIYRGNALALAKDILVQTEGADLYIDDSSSTGLRIAVELNNLRADKPPLTVAPQKFSGYILSDKIDPARGKLVSTYKLRSNELYLLSSASSK